MSPKEKAEELVEKFINYAYDGMSSAEDNAIVIALICVEECIDCSRGRYGDQISMEYWHNVREYLKAIK